MEEGVGLRNRAHALPRKPVHIDGALTRVFPHRQVGLARVEQICDGLVVDFEVGAADLELEAARAHRIRTGVLGRDAIKEVLEDARNEPAVRAASILHLCLRALHCVCLAAARLPVGEDGAVVPGKSISRKQFGASVKEQCVLSYPARHDSAKGFPISSNISSCVTFDPAA